VNSNASPPTVPITIQGSSTLAPVTIDDDDLASKVDTITSMDNTADSPPAPAASAVLLGSSKLAPVDMDADDLASMIDTVEGPPDSSSDSSSNLSISEDPPKDLQGEPLDYHKIIFSGTYYVDPPDDMDTERPEEAPDCSCYG